MSLADSIPSAMRAYELPTTPTPILTIINATLMQIARIPSPSDSDGDRITAIVFGAIKSELVSPLIAAVFMRRWDIDQLAERAFTSTPASFLSAMHMRVTIRARRYSGLPRLPDAFDRAPLRRCLLRTSVQPRFVPRHLHLHREIPLPAVRSNPAQDPNLPIPAQIRRSFPVDRFPLLRSAHVWPVDSQ